MSFYLDIFFPPILKETVDNRLSSFRKDVSSSDNRITVELELQEERLPVQSLIPYALIRNGRIEFFRYDMEGHISIPDRYLHLKLLNNIYSFDTALRVIFSLLLIQNGGFLIHSSSVSVGQKGILFIGVSGSGKTTIAHLNRENKILSDEISAVVKEGGKYYLYGNTFFSDLEEIGHDCSAELKQIYFLNKAPYDDIKPIVKADALKMILRNVMNFSKEAAFSEMILNNALSILRSAGADNIYFLPHREIYKKIYEHLSIEN